MIYEKAPLWFCSCFFIASLIKLPNKFSHLWDPMENSCFNFLILFSWFKAMLSITFKDCNSNPPVIFRVWSIIKLEHNTIECSVFPFKHVFPLFIFKSYLKSVFLGIPCFWPTGDFDFLFQFVPMVKTCHLFMLRVEYWASFEKCK